MTSEYVKLSPSEIVFGEKNLLQSQLEMINIIKNIKTYKESRKQELTFKIALKNKINDLNNQIKEIEKHLPKVKIPEEKKPGKYVREITEEEYEAISLEQELNEIKTKLSRLQQD